MVSMPVAHGGIGFGQTFATSTYGTTLTADAAADTKGTAVELIASTPYDAHWIEVMVGNPSSNGFNQTLDILIGSATEAVLIADLPFRSRLTSDGGNRWLFPVLVPKGSRLSARFASGSGATTCLVAVNLFNGGIGCDGVSPRVVQYGTIAASLGVNVDPGGVAHTDSTPVEITASTAVPHHWLVLTVTHQDNALVAATKWLIDVMIGAATEAVLVGDLPLGGSVNADAPRPDGVFHLPVFVPAGSRLSVRARCSVTTDSDRDLYVVLHGAG